MALVKEIRTSNGALVRIFDDELAKDQAAAWAEARRVRSHIYWQMYRAGTLPEQQAAKTAEQQACR